MLRCLAVIENWNWRKRCVRNWWKKVCCKWLQWRKSEQPPFERLLTQRWLMCMQQSQRSTKTLKLLKVFRLWICISYYILGRWRTTTRSWKGKAASSSQSSCSKTVHLQFTTTTKHLFLFYFWLVISWVWGRLLFWCISAHSCCFELTERILAFFFLTTV